jgi:hypothetical protein
MPSAGTDQFVHSVLAEGIACGAAVLMMRNDLATLKLLLTHA